MKKIIFGLFIISFCSCNNKDSNKKIPTSSETSTHKMYSKLYLNENKVKKLIRKIEKEGDSIAFDSLKEIYYNSGHKKEFLYYSMYMANAYKYNYAFYTNYSLLMSDVITKENKINNIYANYYLLKSYELGYKRAFGAIKERFGESEKFLSSEEYLNNNFNILFEED